MLGDIHKGGSCSFSTRVRSSGEVFCSSVRGSVLPRFLANLKVVTILLLGALANGVIVLRF